MNDESSIIIDSDFSFSDAIVGANAPLEIIDCLPMVDVYEKEKGAKRNEGLVEGLVGSGLEI